MKKNPLEVLTFILKNILIAKAKSELQANIEETKEIISTFLQENYLFFPKMAFYVIGQDTERYGYLFWGALERDTEEAILDDIHYGDELRHLLLNLKSLTEYQRELLKEKIDRAVRRYESEDSDEIYIGSLKQQWYEPLCFDSEFKKLYDEMKKITGRDEKLGPAVGVIVTWTGPGESPLTKEDIFKISNTELVAFLATFKGKNLWEGPTTRALAEILKEVVKEKPEKFVDDMEPFLKTGYLYMYYIFWGLRDACTNNKDFNWHKLFSFLKKYLEQEAFWKDELPIVEERGWIPKHETIVGEIGRLIQEGVKDDEKAVPNELLEDVRYILWLIFDKLPPDFEQQIIRDYLINAFNSTWGKVISAFISFILRIVRVDEKKGEKKEIKWDDNFREKYNSLLDRKVIEAYTWLGYYLPQFHYIDKEWTEKKIIYLKSFRGKKVWEIFMNGYLYTGRVYDNIYELMRPHYKYGIDYDFKESNDRERLIQHISLGYLRGKETLEGPDSLFKRILDRWDTERIKEIIRFFWMQRDYATFQDDESKKY